MSNGVEELRITVVIVPGRPEGFAVLVHSRRPDGMVTDQMIADRDAVPHVASELVKAMCLRLELPGGQQ